MGIIFTLAMKDFRLMLRDKAAFFFTLFFPFAIAVFFGSVFSVGGNAGYQEMGILAVDEDRTPGSAEFIRTLDASAELRVEVTDRAEAEQRVRQGQMPAYIVLKPGFGVARERPFWSGGPRVEMGIDPSRGAEAGMLEGILTRHAAEGMFDIMSDTNRMRASIQDGLQAISLAQDMSPGRKMLFGGFLTGLDSILAEDQADAGTQGTTATAGLGFEGLQPITIEKASVAVERGGPKTSYDVTFPQGAIWAIIGCAASFAVSLAMERTRGTLVRLRMTPIRGWHILAGKALGCFSMSLGIAAALLLFSVLVFGVRPHSPGLLAVALVCAAFGFSGIMMLLSVLGRTEQAATGMSWAVLLICSMAGGGMIPLFAMPGWLQQLSHLSPVKWAIVAMEGAVWRGFSPGEMLLPCAILLGIGLVCFALGLRAFRWTQQA